jgi:hypothetical protein
MEPAKEKAVKETVKKEDDTLKKLRDQLASAKERCEASQRERDESIQKKKIEEELVLIQIAEEQSLTVGVDCKAIFSPKDGSMIVVKTPKEAYFQTFSTKLQKDKVQAADHWDLLKHCLVYPERKALDPIIEAAPGMLIRAVNACIQLASAVEEEVQGK